MRLLIALGILSIAGAWDENFKTLRCYQEPQGTGSIGQLWETRMPMSMENFIALVEKYEENHSMDSTARIADSLIARYRKDGMVYDPKHPGGLMVQPKETFEVDKMDILKKLLGSSYAVPEGTYDPREECSLHFMTSHSTDTYPHPGVDEFWEDSGRTRRDLQYGARSQSLFEFSLRDQQRLSSYSQPGDIIPANHPVENGVVLTSAGPVALGTLLAGISSTLSGNAETIASVLGANEVDYMPDEVKVLQLDPLYATTLSGDIGQAALKGATIGSQTRIFLGSTGMFSNSTAAPKLFTLKEGHGGAIAYMTRAEIFAGIDAMLICNYLKSATASRTKLSQILRMYYSDRGLPGYSDYKACNRMEAYKAIQDEAKTKEQALNFMYAYADTDSLAHQYIDENKDDYESINGYFSGPLDDAFKVFSSFIGTYTYEDYDRCPTYNSNEPKCENTVDLVVVYNREGGTQDSEAQREYITLLAEKVGVGQDRSRLGVIDARNAKWILPLTNISNVADLGANFTMDTKQFGSGGSSADMMDILETMRIYYSDFYNVTNSSALNSTAHSQVVVWNVPRTAPDFNNDDIRQTLLDFREEFPNVYFLMVGSSVGEYTKVLRNQDKDFFKINIRDPEVTADDLAKRVCQVPSMFVYPACDTDIPEFADFNEDGHTFQGFVSPNYTTYAMISPNYFQFSYRVKLKLQSADIRMCASRESMEVDPDAVDYDCVENLNDEIEYHELCTSSNLTLCNPIYISLAALPTANTHCDVSGCQFPDQIQYKIGHEDLLCGAWSFSVSFLLLIIIALIHLLLV